MNTRFIEWIWHIKGTLALAPGQSSDEAFGRLDPLFRETGTSHERTSDTLTFQKVDPAAQDKMSIFDNGVLQIKKDVAGLVLHYRLNSRALLFCFLAPLMFLAFAQLTIAIGKFEKPTPEAAAAAKAKAKAAEKKKVVVPQNPIDKFLGAPAPEKPKKKDDDKSKDDDKHSPKAAYVFAAIFAVLYVIGRILEERLVKSLFRKRLLET